VLGSTLRLADTIERPGRPHSSVQNPPGSHQGVDGHRLVLSGGYVAAARPWPPQTAGAAICDRTIGPFVRDEMTYRSKVVSSLTDPSVSAVV
jgi:hypothetical protein